MQKNGIPLPYRKKETERERKTYIIILSYIVKCEKNVVYVLGIYLEKNLCTVHPVHAVQRISCYPHTYRFIMNGNGRKKHVGLKMVHLPPTYIVTMMTNHWVLHDFAIFPMISLRNWSSSSSSHDFPMFFLRKSRSSGTSRCGLRFSRCPHEGILADGGPFAEDHLPKSAHGCGKIGINMDKP